jgi:hypothetical protein
MVETSRGTDLPKDCQVGQDATITITDISVYRRTFAVLEERMKAGTQKDCFAVEFLKHAENEGFDENQKLFVGTAPARDF